MPYFRDPFPINSLPAQYSIKPWLQAPWRRTPASIGVLLADLRSLQELTRSYRVMQSVQPTESDGVAKKEM